VTTDNDTPQIFGPGAGTGVGTGAGFSGDWRDILAGRPAADPDGEDDPDGPREDQANPAADEWAGWGEPGRPEMTDPGYPQSPLHPRQEEYPAGPDYLPIQRNRPPERTQPPAQAQPGYPQGPGYAMDAGYPADADYARQLGYPQDPGYGPEGAGYPQDPGYGPEGAGYPQEPGYGPEGGDYSQEPGYGPEGGDYPQDGRYLPDLGFVADDGPVPPMEPLPGPELPPAAEQAAPPAAPATGPPWADGARGGNRPDVRPPLPPVPEPEPMRETSDSLTTESLLHGKRAAPGPGWRRTVYRATGGLLRFGESAAEMRRRDLINRVRTPVAGGHHRVAVLSLKGGVGKTTTAVGLGATLATLRGDRVIAIDANPDRGTLSDKVRLETAATIRDLLNERDLVRRYADVRAFTSQAPSRLEVLASDRDPGVSVAFGADDYCDAARVLEHFYSICITDCGTGLLHSAMSGVLRLADQIVLVSSPSVDGARSASATLDWLEAHNCGDLVRNGVVVLSAIRPRSKSTVDLDRLEHHFAARCRAVTRIPYDPHLEEGAEVELEFLNGDTAEAYLALAALVGDGLTWPRRLTSRSALP
jgi:MinD-like ATPase involved in chromosome partitioning or flagellar assembly